MIPDIAPVLEKYREAGRDQLIPLLQEVQDCCGYISMEAVVLIGRELGLPPSKVYGVATFYAQFHMKPHGKHTVRVCRGTACHVRGAPKVMDSVIRHLGVEDGGTTSDMLFSLETVACLGTCFLSPVMLLDSKYFGNLTPAKAVKILESMAASHADRERPAERVGPDA